jgi:hypothetical protein
MNWKSTHQRSREGFEPTILVTSSVFWNIRPYSPLKVNQRFRGTFRLCLQDRIIRQAKNECEAGSKIMVSCLAYFSALKMEATCTSETSVNFQRTTRLCIPDGRTLHNHRLKAMILVSGPSNTAHFNK